MSDRESKPAARKKPVVATHRTPPPRKTPTRKNRDDEAETSAYDDLEDPQDDPATPRFYGHFSQPSANGKASRHGNEATEDEGEDDPLDDLEDLQDEPATPRFHGHFRRLEEKMKDAEAEEDVGDDMQSHSTGGSGGGSAASELFVKVLGSMVFQMLMYKGGR